MATENFSNFTQEEWNSIKQKEKEFFRKIDRNMAELDYRSDISSAEQTGRIEGHIEGFIIGQILRRKFDGKSEQEIGRDYCIELGRQEEKISIAKKMLEMKDTPLNIHERTDLSMDDINYFIEMNNMPMYEISALIKKNRKRDTIQK